MKKLLILPFLLLMLCGCVEHQRARSISRHGTLTLDIDTISIHGHNHEVIYNSISSGYAFMHSPECWCLKETEQ